MFGVGYLGFNPIQKAVLGSQEFFATVGAFFGPGNGLLKLPQSLIPEAVQRPQMPSADDQSFPAVGQG
jgi:hypothetical protein